MHKIRRDTIHSFPDVVFGLLFVCLLMQVQMRNIHRFKQQIAFGSTDRHGA